MNLKLTEILTIEVKALIEALRISCRHPRYFVIFSVMWIQGLVRPVKSRKSRWGYVFLQVIDDLLDGHRPSKENPYEIVSTYKKQFTSKTFPSTPWGHLMKGVASEFEKGPATADGIQEIAKIIDNMMSDHKRMVQRQCWTEAQLQQHHRETFVPSLNLMIMSYGSPFRFHEFHCFVDAMGWCSMIRDIEDDLSRGLINIPQEVLNKGQVCLDNKRINVAALLSNASIKAWLNEQAQKTQMNYKESLKALDTLDPVAKKIVRLFLKSISKYLNRELPNAKTT